MRPLALALIAPLALAASAADADSLRATRSQDLSEVSHRVNVEINRGIATLQVRRTFANRGERHDEAHLVIKTPPGAAATGLRIRAGKRWYEGELLRASEARAMYEKLTGMGRFRPKDPALLQWLWADELELYVFPIAPGKASTVEYTLTVPTEYQDGRYYFSYPRTTGADNLVRPSFEVKTAYGTAVFLDDRPVAPREPTVGSSPSPLLKELDLEHGASHAAAKLTLPWSGPNPPRRVRIQADIRHTYRSDLRVQLITPGKRRIMLANRSGGSDNDLAIDEILAIPERERSEVPGTWTLLVSDFAGKDVGTVRHWSLQPLGEPEGQRGKRIESRAPLAIPDAPTSAGGAGMHRVAVAAPSISTLSARLGRLALIQAHQFTRLEVDVAAELRPLPVNAQVVFVVDLSRSLDDDAVTAQLELARGYLGHVPDAEFAVVGYARFARILSGFEKAERAAAVLERLSGSQALRRRNGSALDLGLRKAEQLLARRPGPRRIVLLTDALLRPTWKNQDALSHLPGGSDQPLIHVVLPSSAGHGQATRNDGHPLVPIARRTGGILVNVDGLRPEQRKGIPELVLGLVRPTRIDNIQHDGPKTLRLPDALDEGSAVREMLEVENAPRRLTITGEIWSSPYRNVVRAQAWFNRVTAALIFPADLHRELTDDEQYRIARYGRAVSPVTSYLAIEPGVRPSTAGIDRTLTGFGSGSGSGYGGVGRGTLGGGSIDWVRFYRQPIESCRKKHGVRAPLTLILDTTRLETVDVEVRGVTGAMRRCVIEVGWNTELPTFHNERDRHTLQL